MSEWQATGRVGKLLEVMRADPERVFGAAEAAKIMGCHPKYVRAGVAYAIANKAMFVKSFGSGVPMMLRGSPFPDGFNAIPMPREKPQSSQRWNHGKDQKPEKGWLTDPDDPRIGKVVQGWKPPKMVHVRGGE